MRTVLLLSCPDRPGIVAAVGGFVADIGGNIVAADQHSDEGSDGNVTFLQRVEFDVPGPLAGPLAGELAEAFAPVASSFDMGYTVHVAGPPRRLAILASKSGHCLGDLLVRDALGELAGPGGFDGQIVAVIANHDTQRDLTARFAVPFHHVPATDDRRRAEGRVAELLEECQPDIVVLARYMLILPAWLVDRWSGRMINVHHSFLPAFAGPRPYQRAHARGVKVIGATAHYVTHQLDEGPIIAQHVLPVSHRDDAAALGRRGRELERSVLAEAVRLHLEHRVLIYGDRTAVFE
jgi:formyltetrahydrofolate deformylase